MLAWVTGNQVLAGGFVTRLLIKIPVDLGASAAILAVVLGGFNAVGISYGAYMVKIVGRVTWCELPMAFIGSLLLPSRGGETA
jgi:hypothetical protein